MPIYINFNKETHIFLNITYEVVLLHSYIHLSSAIFQHLQMEFAKTYSLHKLTTIKMSTFPLLVFVVAVFFFISNQSVKTNSLLYIDLLVH